MNICNSRRRKTNAIMMAMSLAFSGSLLATSSIASDRFSGNDVEVRDQVSLTGARYQSSAITDGETYDRFIVKFKDQNRNVRQSAAQLSLQRANTLSAATSRVNASVTKTRELSVGGEVLHLDRKLSAAEALDFMSNLADQSDIEYVEVDQLNQAYFVPNDSRYNDQWHYYESVGGLNLPNAWNLSTGSGVVVAVLDTGITNHSDLNANVIAGYDFISDPTVAGDGNGRDSDPSDPGDYYNGYSSSWHGTHVAGTIAAVTNNNKGVSGVAYNAKIQPVRVLGRGGGYTSDIAEGIVWASGGTVAGVPNNPTPAKVLNLSLGGSGSCSATYQNAINGAVQRGSVVVVAAGNDNRNVSTSVPANCNNVITVAANSKEGNRAWYSNYGNLIDVTAPGGETCVPNAAQTACQTATPTKGVLSTLNTGTHGPVAESYAYYDGTSMATPHVAGVAALMLSVAPNLTPAQIKSTIMNTARPLPGTCSGGCGAGIVDAYAAVSAVTGGGGNPPGNGSGTLTNGVPVNGISGSANSEQFWTINVPSGTSSLQIAMSGGTGDADLYVRRGSQPTTSSYDCRPWLTGNNETCTIPNPTAGTYHVMIRGYQTFSGVSLVANYSSQTPNVPPVANFTSSVNGLTVNFTDTSTDSDGTIASRSWNFGDGTTSTQQNPTKTYSSAGTYNVTLTVTDNNGATNSKSASVTVSSGSGGNTGVLNNGVPVTGISGAANSTRYFTLAVPNGASNLKITMSGGTGDADLYVRYGAAPTTSAYDCRPWLTGNNESCTAQTPTPGTHHVMIRGYQAFSGVTLVATYDLPGGGNGSTVLTNGVPVTGISGAANSEKFWTIQVPAGASNLRIETSGGSGDVDLYVRVGAAPTTSNYDCRPWLTGNNESCVASNPAPGTYHVMLRGYQTYAGVTLKASYTP